MGPPVSSQKPEKINPKRPVALDERPFEGMSIDDTSILDELEGRSPCPKCYKSRKYFCYSCRVPVRELEGHLPVLKLPVKIDIIKHRHEIDGKSTAIHAEVLAPGQVTIYTYPNIPEYSKTERVFLVYPSRTAVDLRRLFTDGNDSEDESPPSSQGSRLGTLMTKRSTTILRPTRRTRPDRLPIDRAVFIDSTWNQSRGIYGDERLKSLPCVVIQNRISQFWRYQKGSPRWYLATIEAVHQFLIEIHLNMWGVSPTYIGPHCEDHRDSSNANDPNLYSGQYDNILFFFSHMYKKIHSLYEHDRLSAYKRPMD